MNIQDIAERINRSEGYECEELAAKYALALLQRHYQSGDVEAVLHELEEEGAVFNYSHALDIAMGNNEGAYYVNSY